MKHIISIRYKIYVDRKVSRPTFHSDCCVCMLWLKRGNAFLELLKCVINFSKLFIKEMWKKAKTNQAYENKQKNMYLCF